MPLASRTLVLVILALTSAAWAQRGEMFPTAVVPAPGSGGWKVGKTTPEQVAARLDRTLKSMQGVLLETKSGLELGGRPGEGDGIVQVRNGKTWRIQVPEMQANPPRVGFALQIADGRNFVTLGEKGYSVPRPVAQRTWSGNIVDQWPLGFPKLMLAGLGTNRNPFSELVAGYRTRRADFRLLAEERTFVFQGQTRRQQRIFVERIGPARQRFGPMRMDMVMDSQIGVLVTVRVNIDPLNAKRTRVNWTSRWRNNQKFPNETFRLPR